MECAYYISSGGYTYYFYMPWVPYTALQLTTSYHLVILDIIHFLFKLLVWYLCPDQDAIFGNDAAEDMTIKVDSEICRGDEHWK